MSGPVDEATLQVVGEQLARLKARAVAATTADELTQAVTAANALIEDLLSCGILSVAEANGMAHEWLHDYVAARVRSMPRQAALRMLWQREGAAEHLAADERLAFIRRLGN